MPVTASTYISNFPVRAREFNTDLYTYQPGNNHSPNGVLFHANPPTFLAFMNSGSRTQPSSAGGSFNNMSGSSGSSGWRNWMDNAVLFGTGSDFAGNNATGGYTCNVPASSENNGDFHSGGCYLFFGFPSWSAQTTAGSVCGAATYNAGVQYSVGCLQSASTTRQNTSYVVDLLVTNLNGSAQASFPYALGGFSKDTAGTSFTYATSSDPTGAGSRMYATWVMGELFNATPGVVTVPVPSPPAWTAASTVTAAALNGDALANAMNFLNNRPILRTAGGSATVPQNVTTIVTTSVSIDNIGNFVSNKYTIPSDGVYLVSALTEFTDNTGGSKQAGVRVVGTGGAGTFDLLGPAYQASTTSALMRPAMTRLLGLRAGDTLQLITFSNASGPVYGSTGRLVVVWMSAIAPSNGAWSWTPPDTSYRWMAGTPAAQMPAAFQQHLTNDVSFLIQRPYLLAYQSTAQTTLAQNVFTTVNCNTLGSRIHTVASGVGGDSYGGWTSGAANKYTAMVPGWYLAVANGVQSAPGAVCECIMAIGAFSPGGGAQGLNAPSWFQRISSQSGSLFPGAEAIGLFYLDVGDYLQPLYQQLDGPATYATSVTTAGQESSFGVVWISE